MFRRTLSINPIMGDGEHQSPKLLSPLTPNDSLVQA
ncbi:hypothetical protein SAMN05444745_12516 [Arthrobacter sp. OV608]|jgi:hypothetical protein|nr:hypothetical protein SAMN05444745_12516 [Arthrobacter sp. OV608]